MKKEKKMCGNSNIVIKKDGEDVIMSIIGDFDGSTTPLVHECCKKISKIGINKVTLDFGKATHVDTTAFACIVSFIKEHAGQKTEISVTNLHDPEKRLLEMLKVEKMIRIV